MTDHSPITATILGGASWNTVIYVDVFPEPHPQTVFASRSRRTVGSSGAGKALNLADLGVETRLWALLGDDEQGGLVRGAIEDAGIHFVSQLDPLGTMRHVNLMDKTGERISIFENPGTLDATPEPGPILPLLEGADVVAITIMEHCRPLLGLVEEAGHDRWIDIHDYDGTNPHHRDFIDSATHLFVSTIDLPDWRRFAEDRITAGTTVVVCTHGAEGASGLTADEGWIDIPAVPVDTVVDSNGAGDAFFAGFAVAWCSGTGLAAALEAGADQASHAVASPDLAPIRGDTR